MLLQSIITIKEMLFKYNAKFPNIILSGRAMVPVNQNVFICDMSKLFSVKIYMEWIFLLKIINL